MSIFSERESSITSVDAINHLQTYNIEVNNIGNNQIDARYLLIDGNIQQKYTTNDYFFY